MVDIDAFDRKLLERVRRNNLEPARLMADAVGLSVSAVLRRLRRLRDEGVITADVSLVDPALTGSALTLHVLVRMKEPGRRTRDTFARVLEDRDEVTGAWEVTGDDDYVLRVQVATMGAYDAFAHEVLGDDVGVASFKTLITIKPVVEEDATSRPLVLPTR